MTPFLPCGRGGHDVEGGDGTDSGVAGATSAIVVHTVPLNNVSISLGASRQAEVENTLLRDSQENGSCFPIVRLCHAAADTTSAVFVETV